MKQENNPLITVFVPFSTQSDWSLLELSLFSLSGQSYTNFNVLIGIDGSEEDIARVKDLFRQQPFPEVIHASLRVISLTSNTLLGWHEASRLADGKFLLILESNSVLYTNTLKVLSQQFQDLGKTVVFAGARKSLMAPSYSASYFETLKKQKWGDSSHPRLDCFLWKNGSLSSCLIDRERVDLNQIFAITTAGLSKEYQILFNVLNREDIDTHLFHTPLSETYCFSESSFDSRELFPQNEQLVSNVSVPLGELQSMLRQYEAIQASQQRRIFIWASRIGQTVSRHPKFYRQFFKFYSAMRWLVRYSFRGRYQ